MTATVIEDALVFLMMHFLSQIILSDVYRHLKSLFLISQNQILIHNIYQILRKDINSSGKIFTAEKDGVICEGILQ